jgi:hypothetical protein
MKNILATITQTYSKVEEIDWQDVYHHSLPKIFHYFCYKVGDPIVAEDLSAITFEKAWKSRFNFRKDSGQVQAWLLGIARNVASDHFRKKSREISLEVIAESDLSSSFDEDIQRKLDFQTILAVLSQFPDRDRIFNSNSYTAKSARESAVPIWFTCLGSGRLCVGSKRGHCKFKELGLSGLDQFQFERD